MMSGNDFRLYHGMDSSEFLAHYGRGHLDGGNSGRYKWGSGKNPHQRSGKRVFVSGSSKTQDKESGYYRRKLPKAVRAELDAKMRNGDTILVGDAPGIDRQVQDYLKKKRYKNVEVYGPGSEDVRYQADKGWKKNLVDDPDHEQGSSEWLAAKDKAMSDSADEGIAVILDKGAKATRNNIARLMDDDKQVSVYELNSAGKELDRWLDENGKQTVYDACKEAYRKELDRQLMQVIEKRGREISGNNEDYFYRDQINRNEFERNVIDLYDRYLAERDAIVTKLWKAKPDSIEQRNVRKYGDIINDLYDENVNYVWNRMDEILESNNKEAKRLADKSKYVDDLIRNMSKCKSEPEFAAYCKKLDTELKWATTKYEEAKKKVLEEKEQN